MLVCTVCSEWYPYSNDHLDVCPDCVAANFAGSPAQPVDDGPAPARAALFAYVSAPVTARQRAALTRMAARWAEEGARVTPHAVYRCFYCNHDLHRILDHGTERLLWCSRCACRRRFVRQDEPLVAQTWPPPLREESP